MPPTEYTFFSITLFLALVALLEWKRRRMAARERISRGLKEYVDNETPPSETEDRGDQSLAIAQ